MNYWVGKTGSLGVGYRRGEGACWAPGGAGAAHRGGLSREPGLRGRIRAPPGRTCAPLANAERLSKKIAALMAALLHITAGD